MTNLTMKKHQGSCSELRACVWLLEHGYEVYRNVSSHGYADLVALKDGKSYLFDVKTSTHETSEFGQRLTPNQLAAGVMRLCVYPDGNCSIDWAPKPSVRDLSFSCPICSTITKRRKIHQIYCSNHCRQKAHPRRERRMPA